jgi:predicted acetyltransferase
MALEVRPCADMDEFRRAVDAIAQYFGPPVTEERIGRFSRVLDVDRMHAAFEDDVIIGGAGAFGFDFAVPGGSLPCAGISVVGVYPTHRRRGVLRAMMDAQLLDVHERGEPLAALWASEETIYGRFGYGLASWCGEITVERFRAAVGAARKHAARDVRGSACAISAGV